MTKKLLLFALITAGMPFMASAATSCSKANLTRCLDSVCAINVSSNPAARCQYCGTASAGTPADDGMRAVSVGTSSKYTLTSKELRSAPTDPGARYAWATTECLKKVTGCTPDDVTDTYDSLIEQSCKAAGINAEMAALHAAAAKKKSSTACNTTIRACVMASTKCGADWRACREDAVFDKFYAACGVEATGCDEYISEIRTALQSARDTTLASAQETLLGIVAAYQANRERQLVSAQNGCRDNSARLQCIETVCERNMPGKCAPGKENEKSIATQLCKFYDLACNVLK